MRSARLDATDWRILHALQADGRITNVDLARKVGISAPACLRRARALEDAGIIKGFTALLNDKALGFEVTAFAMIRLHSQAEGDLVAGVGDLTFAKPLEAFNEHHGAIGRGEARFGRRLAFGRGYSSAHVDGLDVAHRLAKHIRIRIGAFAAQATSALML